jgi:23S rRNA (guanosine2251-2'-O)-methyltransferase
MSQRNCGRDDARHMNTNAHATVEHSRLAAECSSSHCCELAVRPRRKISVLLDGVHEPANLGTIFRLCDAFAIRHLIICGVELELHHPSFAHASGGAENFVHWSAANEPQSVITQARAEGAWILVAAVTEDMTLIGDLKARFPVLLVLGSESDGVCTAVLDACDAIVAVPTLGTCRSLGLASAAAIVLYSLADAADARQAWR